ncbi:MAG: hypothetical protein N3B13_00560 [Deltaproteobacteria bacterium]|nr:hypothetical protein [Deltaproteobacteria bacterium]
MKNILFWTLIFMAFVFSCSGDDGANLDCDKYCEKAAKCGEMSAEEKESCQKFCNNINNKGYFDSNYLKNLNSCMNNDDCDKVESCVEEAQKKCPSVDASKYYESMCDKMIECKQTTDSKEKCIENQKKENNDFACMTEKYISDMANCFSKVSCSNYISDMMNCVTLILQ